MIKHLLNRFKSHRDYSYGSAVASAMPVEVNIEITSFCNLDCPMCGRGKKETPNSYLEIDTFKSIIDQVSSHAELVFLSAGVGEPIAHPKFSEMISYCKSKGLKVLVSTNATLLSEKKIAQLLESPPDILILSLDGATKETHESIRVGSVFEKTMQNVENLCSAKLKLGSKSPFIICQMIYMPQNQAEADQFVSKWSAVKGVNSVRIKKLNYVMDSEMFSEEKVVNIEALNIRSNNKAEDSVLRGRDLGCLYPWRQMVVSAEGEVGLCCRDHNFKFKAGNVKENTVASLWNSSALQDARQKIGCGNKSKISLCKECDGIQTGFITGMGVQLLDAHTIHRLSPIMERIGQKINFKVW